MPVDESFSSPFFVRTIKAANQRLLGVTVLESGPAVFQSEKKKN